MDRAEDGEMRGLALRLRQAAVDAGRADVAAKVDEIVVLIEGEVQSDKAGSVIKFLDGLGF